MNQRNFSCKYYHCCDWFNRAAWGDQACFDCRGCPYFNSVAHISETEPCGLIGYWKCLAAIFSPELFKEYQEENKKVKAENVIKQGEKELRAYRKQQEVGSNEPKKSKAPDNKASVGKVGRLLRADQVAESLNVSKRKAYRLIAAGHFEVLKMDGSLRVTERSVEAYKRRVINLYILNNG